ncbi:MAG: YraN family protein [Planctomycetaceae bacterium]|jgi:hypothetical protein|nr:YraN family protein [Planctomycetaceae bacterium]
MSTTQTVPTFEQMMQMFRETRESIKETRESIKETRESIQNFAINADRAIQKVAEQQAITSQELKNYIAESREAREEREKLSKEFNTMRKRFGDISEHMVFSSVVVRFNELGYSFQKEFLGHYKIKDTNKQTIAEIDILLENGNTIALVEVKTKPDNTDVKDFLERIEKFKQYRIATNEPPKTIIGAITGAVFPDKVKEKAIQAGLYVMVQSGDTMKFDIPENFIPKKF